MTLNFGVYGKLRSKDNFDLVDSLDQHPHVGEVLYHEVLAEQLNKEGYTIKEMEGCHLDFIMTIGGDGTILRLLQKTNMKILGMNTGRVGFLTAKDLPEINKTLDMIEKGEYFIDERIKLEVILNGEVKGECTNEATVHTDKIAKMRAFKVYQDGMELDSFRADGLIVSTPTGSTCYAMSAGGPIVDPEVEAFVVVPISPYKLTTKPYVVPVNKQIHVKLVEEKPCLLVLDGQKELKVSSDDEIYFSLSEKRARFISFEKDFYKRIRKKLVWK